ncbi:hypothetical protein [Roseimarinus sediminis]|uniref:hypothetical protein n=1 Tax=Roseimarinus sediminis TaxID=1610899 RepID=UPI003D24AA9D
MYSINPENIPTRNIQYSCGYIIKSLRKLVSSKKSEVEDFWNEKEGKIEPKSKSNDENRKLELINSKLLKRRSKLKIEIINLKARNPFYTIQDVADLYDIPTASIHVFDYFETIIARLESTGRLGKAKAKIICKENIYEVV